MNYGKKDANHSIIVAALKSYGVSVRETHSVGNGVSDCIAAKRPDGAIWLEIKMPSADIYAAQIENMAESKFYATFVSDFEGALSAVNYPAIYSLDKKILDKIALEIRRTSKAKKPTVKLEKFWKMYEEMKRQ